MVCLRREEHLEPPVCRFASRRFTWWSGGIRSLKYRMPVPDSGRLEEERRLFYVAVTRARERLCISGHAQNRRGYRRELSQFVSAIDRRHLRFE